MSSHETCPLDTCVNHETRLFTPRTVTLISAGMATFLARDPVQYYARIICKALAKRHAQRTFEQALLPSYGTRMARILKGGICTNFD